MLWFRSACCHPGLFRLEWKQFQQNSTLLGYIENKVEVEDEKVSDGVLRRRLAINIGASLELEQKYGTGIEMSACQFGSNRLAKKLFL